MPRLSVSLEEEQATWIAQRADELGVSKGKVVRESIDHIRTGDSVFTNPVNTDEVISERLESLEGRLRTLEESIDSPQEPARKAGPRKTGALQSDALAETSRGQDDGHPGKERPPAVGSTGHDSGAQEPDSDTQDSPSNRGATSTDEREDRQASGIGTQPEDTTGQESRAADASSGSSDSSEDESEQRSTNEQRDESPQVESGDDSDTDGIQKVNVEKTATSIRTYLMSELGDQDQADAVTSCWELLEKRGTVHVRALNQHYEEYPLGRDSAEEWWTQDIKPHLDSLPGIILPEGNGSFYRFKY